MESVSGVNNWKLVIRRKAAGVAILWAATCDAKAALPDTLFGLPVTAPASRRQTSFQLFAPAKTSMLRLLSII